MGPGFVICNQHIGYMNAHSFRTIYSITVKGASCIWMTLPFSFIFLETQSLFREKPKQTKNQGNSPAEENRVLQEEWPYLFDAGSETWRGTNFPSPSFPWGSNFKRGPPHGPTNDALRWHLKDMTGPYLTPFFSFLFWHKWKETFIAGLAYPFEM
jgi:hypothetical protein